MKIIREGKAEIYVHTSEKISKEMPVFYNPIMETNRSISILLLKALGRKMRCAEIMAGTGVRGIRFLKELKGMEMHLNDYSTEAVKLIKKNLGKNKVKAAVTQKDASIFLLESTGFDYIDVDPFGYPGPFLDAACKRIARNGILAVTATDTAALSGTYPDACIRKYWAKPKLDELKHETGLRILIRRVQLIGASYEKALIPIFSYSQEHYMRTFFLCEKSKEKCNAVLEEQGMWEERGPLWKGKLWDEKIVGKMIRQCKEEKLRKFLELISDESKIGTIGFYHIHKICKKERKTVPRFNVLLEKVRRKGYKASRTHFDPEGIRSDLSYGELVKLL